MFFVGKTINKRAEKFAEKHWAQAFLPTTKNIGDNSFLKLKKKKSKRDRRFGSDQTKKKNIFQELQRAETKREPKRVFRFVKLRLFRDPFFNFVISKFFLKSNKVLCF